MAIETENAAQSIIFSEVFNAVFSFQSFSCKHFEFFLIAAVHST